MREWIDLVENPAPRFLYHGTAKTNVDAILRRGLDPKFSQSSLQGIFLAGDKSTAENYANMHYQTTEEWVVLQIDVSMLEEDRLGPDNYELAELLSDLPETHPLADHSWNECTWLESLEISDQCVYYGVIQPEAISIARDELNETHDNSERYIRFGDIPANERSEIGRAPNIYSRHVQPGDREKGVSVFEAEWSDDLKRWMIVDVGNFASLEALLIQQRPAFLVTGKVVGIGMDEETLLRQVQIVEEIPYDRLWVRAWGNDGAVEEWIDIVANGRYNEE